MNLLKIMRNGLIGTLIAVVPAATTIAATRPSAAVPMAGSTSTAAAAQGYDDDHGISWLVWAGIGVAVVMTHSSMARFQRSPTDARKLSEAMPPNPGAAISKPNPLGPTCSTSLAKTGRKLW